MSADNRVEDFDAIAKRLQAEIEANGGAISYKVSVVKIEQGVTENQGDYSVLAEVEGEGKAYGYPPSRPETFKRESQLFSQSVTELDLVEVVKAVNGLK